MLSSATNHQSLKQKCIHCYASAFSFDCSFKTVRRLYIYSYIVNTVLAYELCGWLERWHIGLHCRYSCMFAGALMNVRYAVVSLTHANQLSHWNCKALLVISLTQCYEGRNLQNSVILLVFQILKIWNIRFVGNLILSSSCKSYDNDVTLTSFINVKYGDVATEILL